MTRPKPLVLALIASLLAPLGAAAEGDMAVRSLPAATPQGPQVAQAAVAAMGVSSPAYPAAGRQGGYPGAYQGGTVRVDLSGDQADTRSMTLPRGKSAVIELPRDAQDVVVSDPKVADVVLSTRRRIFVLGVGGGQTDASFYDSAGHPILRRLRGDPEPDPSRLPHSGRGRQSKHRPFRGNAQPGGRGQGRPPRTRLRYEA